MYVSQKMGVTLSICPESYLDNAFGPFGSYTGGQKVSSENRFIAKKTRGTILQYVLLRTTCCSPKYRRNAKCSLISLFNFLE